MKPSLDGPLLKLRCAESDFERFRDCEIDLAKRTHALNDYRAVRAEFDPDRGKDAYRVLIDFLPPDDIGVLIGAMAHNLRSALDGLAWPLALLKTKRPSDRTAFPIFKIGKTARKRKDGSEVPQFAKRGSRMISDLRPEHQAAIERLQPYKGGHGFRRNPLWQLHEVNRIDKHRLVQIVGAYGNIFIYGAAAAATRFDIMEVEMVSGPLKDGAIIAYSPPDMNMDIQSQPKVSFAQGCDAVRGLPVFGTFQNIIRKVEQIIESFGPEFT